MIQAHVHANRAKSDIFNTDQGSQFTGSAFTGVLASNGIAISMDGKGAWRDNMFVERCGAASKRIRGSHFDRPLLGLL
jgi:putative transposase